MFARVADYAARMSASTYAFFAVCAPGLEGILDDELRALGLFGEVVVGGVQGRGSFADLGKILLWSRVAESLRVRLKGFAATDFGALYQGLERLPWHAFVRSGAAVSVSVTCRKSKLFHSDAVAERVQRVIATRRPGEPDQSLPEQKIDVRIVKDWVTVSVDASGERLHKRGYRTHVENAPLRETLAAAAAAKLEESRPAVIRRVWDPFCGSGVLGLEWLQLRLKLAPGGQRSFAVEQWPTFDADQWQALRREATSGTDVDAGTLQVIGSDVDAKCLKSAAHNARAAGLESMCNWLSGDFSSVAERIPEGTAILTNPPYGKRLGSPRLARRLYHRFEQLLLERTDLRPVLVVSGYPGLLERARLPWKRLLRTQSGGLNVNFLGLPARHDD